MAASSKKLRAEELMSFGFIRSGAWAVRNGSPTANADLPKDSGVYAFALNGEVVYIGVALMGLRKRLYFYGRPGPRQETNLRLNPLIKSEIEAGRTVEIFSLIPGTVEWNGLPVDVAPGLETALIRVYRPRWNRRG